MASGGGATAFKYFTMHQNVIDGSHPLLTTTPTGIMRIFSVLHKDSDILKVFDHARPLGISGGYDKRDGKLVYLAIADDKCCRIVRFEYSEGTDGRGSQRPSLREKPPPQEILICLQALQDNILRRPYGSIYGFDMGPLSMALFDDLDLRIQNAVDIQSAFAKTERDPLTVMTAALGDEATSFVPVKISKTNVQSLFYTYSYDTTVRGTMADNDYTDVAMRAWVAQFLANFENGEAALTDVPRIDTYNMSVPDLQMISKVANDATKMDEKKPLQIKHQFEQSVDAATGQVQIKSTNYNNKLRADRNVRVKVTGPRGDYYVNSTVSSVSGRAGTINKADRNLAGKTIVDVVTTGRDVQTRAEIQRAEAILYHLQNPDKSFQANPWIKNIYYPPPEDDSALWPEDWTPKKEPNATINREKTPSNILTLNKSQQLAVNYMVSGLDDHRITIVQGPPGTGKTSVIGAYVQLSVEVFDKTGIWLVAQSNVAVKNIAEKLIKIGFTPWRLLVSKDFHFDWHEHIYQEHIKTNVIRSDTFPFLNTGEILQGVKVILCTLSMLSSMFIKKFTRVVPLNSLVVDEASQIEIGDYISVFHKFDSLRKACFIGDNKQLPPFGQEDFAQLQSIFEVAHLGKKVIFLDTQYRMPPQIGRIISTHVYDGKLNSNPLHPVKDKSVACYFLDAIDGKEMQMESRSYRNEVEANIVLALAEKLQEKMKSFKIITPYAEQTTFIEASLKKKGLDWEDKCFNVDSFQGNEEDFIIISVVRSFSLGFLTNLRRTNVMLSRCKRGMFIVSSKKFLEGSAKDTLIGKFLKETHGASDKSVWLTPRDIQEETFLTDSD